MLPKQLPPVLGAYRIVETLGRGGQATVYRAVHASLERPVALKVLDPVRAADRKYTDRFHREARVAARLSHPNLVGVYDSGATGAFHWLAMELIDGQSVAQRLADRGALPVDEAIRVTREVARALEYTSSEGVVHRDVKPHNVLLARDGRIKLADLGLAKGNDGADQLTVTGAFLGTPSYMPPEQLRAAKSLDVRADIYALGVTFYEMLTGHLPLAAETALEMAIRHANEDVPPPSSSASHLTPAIDAVVQRMTERDRRRRYADARELGEDLDALAAGELPPHAGGRPRRARPRPVGKVAVAGLLLAAGALGATVATLAVGGPERPVPARPEHADPVAAEEPGGGEVAAGGDRAAPASAAERLRARQAAEDTRSPLARAARAIEQALADDDAGAALAAYRAAGPGERLDLLAEAIERQSADGAVLWAWAAVDRAAVADAAGARRALEESAAAAGADAAGAAAGRHLAADLLAFTDGAFTGDPLAALGKLDEEGFIERLRRVVPRADELGYRSMACLRAFFPHVIQQGGGPQSFNEQLMRRYFIKEQPSGPSMPELLDRTRALQPMAERLAIAASQPGEAMRFALEDAAALVALDAQPRAEWRCDGSGLRPADDRGWTPARYAASRLRVPDLDRFARVELLFSRAPEVGIAVRVVRQTGYSMSVQARRTENVYAVSATPEADEAWFAGLLQGAEPSGRGMKVTIERDDDGQGNTGWAVVTDGAKGIAFVPLQPHAPSALELHLGPYAVLSEVQLVPAGGR